MMARIICPSSQPCERVRSRGALKKQCDRMSEDGLPISSFEDLLLELNSLCVADMDWGTGYKVPVVSKPTALQARVFALLGGKVHPAPGEARRVQ